eukprot:m.41820 g.41820  ORF g.41820 m.41820 type:complete len:52 (+) comp8254_c0_seq1:42-197(+)
MLCALACRDSEESDSANSDQSARVHPVVGRKVIFFMVEVSQFLEWTLHELK